jgi:hypothetical protein
MPMFLFIHPPLPFPSPPLGAGGGVEAGEGAAVGVGRAADLAEDEMNVSFLLSFHFSNMTHVQSTAQYKSFSS